MRERACSEHAHGSLYIWGFAPPDRQPAPRMACHRPNCILDLVAELWVPVFHRLVKDSKVVQGDEVYMRSMNAQAKIGGAIEALRKRESQLDEKDAALTLEAGKKKSLGDLAGARRRLLDRRRVREELARIDTGVRVLQVQVDALEGTEVTKTVADALKVAVQAMGRDVSNESLQAITDVVEDADKAVSDVEEINRLMARSMNSMGTDDGWDVDRELEELLSDGDRGVEEQHFLSNGQRVPPHATPAHLPGGTEVGDGWADARGSVVEEKEEEEVFGEYRDPRDAILAPSAF